MSIDGGPFLIFEAVHDLSEREFEDLLSSFAPDDENQAIDLWPEYIRRRRRLLRAPLQVGRLTHNRTFAAPSNTEPVSMPDNVDIFLSRCYIAESLEATFDAQIQIGAEHEFQGGEKTTILHSRTEPAAVQNDMPLFNTCFANNVKVAVGSNLVVRLIHLEGSSGKTVRGLMSADAFKDGIKAASTFNPIFGMAAKTLEALTEVLLQNRKNRVIAQGIYGFRGSLGELGYSLGQGDYLFAQLPSDMSNAMSEGRITLDPGGANVLLDGTKLDANYFLLSIQESKQISS